MPQHARAPALYPPLVGPAEISAVSREGPGDSARDRSARRLCLSDERKGVVGPSEGSKARAVLMTVEEFEEMQGNAA